MDGSRKMGFDEVPSAPAGGAGGAGAAAGGAAPEGTPDRSTLTSRLEELRRKLNDCDWSDPELLVRAAGLCAELDQRDEAVNMLSRALELDPRHAYARTRLLELAGPEALEGISVPVEIVPLSKRPLEVFAYPLRGAGPIMIGMGGVFYALLFTGLAIAAGIFIVFPIALAVSLIFIGYLIEFFRKVTFDTINGGKQSPDWPDLDFGQFVLPIKAAFIYLVLMLPTVGLAVLTALRVVDLGDIGNDVMLLIAGEINGLVLPMAMLIFFVRRSALEALHPVRLFASISACGREYWLAAGICLVIAPLRKGVMVLLGAIPLAGPILSTAAMIYFAMVACRALGLVYRSCEQKLSW